VTSSNKSSPSQVVGVDGTKKGWVAVRAEDGEFAGATHHPDIADLAATYLDARVIAIDIPLFFPLEGSTEPRAADVAGRKLLGRRSSSLFNVPPRAVLEAADHTQANALSKKLTGSGLSAQSYALRSKILEAVTFLEATKDRRFHEVHPEISFHLLAASQGSTITASKKTWNGLAERFRLLQKVHLAPSLKVPLKLGATAPDDLLDAAAAAWTAQRIAEGVAEMVPGEPVKVEEVCANGNVGVIWG
jgi:predicted RNase H-like nuclease